MYSLPEFKNLVEMTIHQAHTRGDTEATRFLKDNNVVDGSQSFRQLDADARKIAAELVTSGLGGRNVLLLYTPGLDYVKAFFGSLYAGCVPVPAYPPVGSKDLVRLKNVAVDCRAGAILSNSVLKQVIDTWVANITNGLPLPCIATDTLPDTHGAATLIPHQAEPDDVAFLQYTSGSTGHPKGVMVTHGNLLTNFKQILRGFCDGNAFVDKPSDLRTVIWLPPFHDMGLIGGVLTPLFAGAHVTLMSPLTFLKRPFNWLKAISDQQAHVSGGPNFCYQYCVQKITEAQAEQLDLSNWQIAFNGAEPVSAEALKNFASHFRVSGFRENAFLPCYGLAEASLFVAGSPSGRGSRTLQARLDKLEQGHFAEAEHVPTHRRTELVSSGVAAAGTTIRIVDPQTCIPCADGTVGEIWVQSASVAQGYWGKPQFSASVFAAKIVGNSHNDGYLRTGDLGFLWHQELFVTGRIKEVVIVAGRNHYPQDIEHTLQESNPSFRLGGGAAFSCNIDGKEQLVILQEVSKNAGDQADYRLLAAEAVRVITARHGVTPHALVLVAGNVIPKTSSGKIRRADAKQLYREGSFAATYIWQADTAARTKPVTPVPRHDVFDLDWHSELYTDLQTWVADKLDVEPHHVNLDVTFSELGVDSVEAVELVDRLQDRIQRTIPAIELLRYPTVKALIDHFAEELAQRTIKQLNDGDVRDEPVPVDTHIT